MPRNTKRCPGTPRDVEDSAETNAKLALSCDWFKGTSMYHVSSLTVDLELSEK